MREKPLILLVDDEAGFREIFSTKLMSCGYDVATASDAASAIDSAAQIKPDLILMDIMMPGETGTDAALALQQKPETKGIKIAFLSNMKDPWPRTTTPRDELAKMLGMEDFIDKTIDLDLMVGRIKAILTP